MVCEEGVSKCRYNYEIQALFKTKAKGKGIVNLIRLSWLHRPGYVAREIEQGPINEKLQTDPAGLSKQETRAQVREGWQRTGITNLLFLPQSYKNLYK